MGKEEQSSVRVEGEYFEIHWYEHSGLGRFEEKQVRVKLQVS